MQKVYGKSDGNSLKFSCRFVLNAIIRLFLLSTLERLFTYFRETQKK